MFDSSLQFDLLLELFSDEEKPTGSLSSRSKMTRPVQAQRDHKKTVGTQVRGKSAEQNGNQSSFGVVLDSDFFLGGEVIKHELPC